MAFWRCYYHIVWTVKHREPLITPQAKAVIFDSIRDKSAELESPILVLNGVEDHLHVALNIPPKRAVAEWVRRVKGASSHAVNTRVYPDTHFRWQEGYGALTFGVKNLAFVVDYINRQKEHHVSGPVKAYLETTDEA
jgi:putative transposase